MNHKTKSIVIKVCLLAIAFALGLTGRILLQHDVSFNERRLHLNEECIESCQPFRWIDHSSLGDDVLCICDSQEGPIVKELER